MVLGPFLAARERDCILIEIYVRPFEPRPFNPALAVGMRSIANGYAVKERGESRDAHFPACKRRGFQRVRLSLEPGFGDVGKRGVLIRRQRQIVHLLSARKGGAAPKRDQKS